MTPNRRVALSPKAVARYKAAMAEIINLRMARKAKARNDAQHQAQASRARHGLTKTERSLAQAEQARLDRVVDGAKLGLSENAED